MILVSRTVLLSLRLLIFIGRGVMVEMVEEFSFNVRTMFKLLPNFYLKTHRYRKNRARTSANCCLRPLLPSTYHVAAAMASTSRQTRLPANPETQVLPLFLSPSLHFHLYTARKRHLHTSKPRDRGATPRWTDDRRHVPLDPVNCEIQMFYKTSEPRPSQ